MNQPSAKMIYHPRLQPRKSFSYFCCKFCLVNAFSLQHGNSSWHCVVILITTLERSMAVSCVFSHNVVTEDGIVLCFQSQHGNGGWQCVVLSVIT